MSELRKHPLKLTLVAFVLAAATVVVIAGAYGFGAFADAWKDLHPRWLALTVCAELLAMPAYAISYRVIARVNDGPRLPFGLVMRVVVAGFGPFAAGGGFALDKRVLHATGNDERRATVQVLGLGALEWALLAPAAWLSAVVLLVGGSSAMPSLLWPWALIVPPAFVLGLWLAVPERRKRLTAPGRALARLEVTFRGVGVLHLLAKDIATCWVAWVGAAAYWVLEIAAFYGALRFIGLHPSGWATILAYATGYALTRRSLPLGGAGATEALMTFALHWVGIAVPAALASVVVYRVGNFVLPTIPALIARPHVTPLIDAGEERDEREPRARRRQRRPALERSSS